MTRTGPMSRSIVGVYLLLVLQEALAAPTDAPTDASTESPTDAPTPAPPTPSPPSKLKFVVNLDLQAGFSNFDESSLVGSVRDQFPNGTKVDVSLEYKITTSYVFSDTVNESQAVAAVAQQCSVTESQVSVTIGGARRMLRGADSSRRLQVSTSVDAVITSTTPAAAAAIHTAAGNATGIAAAMSVIAGKSIAEPTVTTPKASVAVTTSLTAASDQIAALSNVVQYDNVKDALATAAKAVATIDDCQVIAANGQVISTSCPTPGTTGSPSTTVAPQGSTTANSTADSNTTASPRTTAGKAGNTDTESVAVMRGLSSIVAIAVTLALYA